MPKLNREQLFAWEASVPPLNEQRQVVATLQHQMDAAQETSTKLEGQLAAINQLPAALLRRAFSGELSTHPVAVHVPNISGATRTKTTEEERAAILAHIVDYTYGKPDFYRTILAKDLYLTEAHAGVPLDGEYLRQAAGPFATDFYHLEELAIRKEWIIRYEHKRSHKRSAWSFDPGPKIAKSIEVVKSRVGEQLPILNNMLNLLASEDTDNTEMIATLFAVWNDFLIEGKEPTEEQIIHEFRENWHAKKGRFSPQELSTKLDWMRTHGLVPTGTGPHTVTAKK